MAVSKTLLTFTPQTAILPQVIKRNDMTKNKVRVVIYRPDGTKKSYITRNAEDAREVDDTVVDIIELSSNEVMISVNDEGTIDVETYVGMPYYVNMW